MVTQQDCEVKSALALLGVAVRVVPPTWLHCVWAISLTTTNTEGALKLVEGERTTRRRYYGCLRRREVAIEIAEFSNVA